VRELNHQSVGGAAPLSSFLWRAARLNHRIRFTCRHRPETVLMQASRFFRGPGRRILAPICAAILALGLTACGSLFGGHSKAASATEASGSDGLSLFGSGPNAAPAKVASGIGVGVNSYLWHASLDTLSFMPLASADPFGGVIITDWYAPPTAANERFKVTVYILARTLRADALKVSVFRQQQDAKGNWVDAALDPETPAKLENAILTRARQMRLSTPSSQ
jgi:hypothetical protein